MTKQTATTLLRIVLGALSVAAFGFLIWAAFWGDIVVTRTEAQIRDIVDKQLVRMASEESQRKNAAARNLKILEVGVSIIDAIAITAKVEGRRFAQAFSATVHVVGVPEYRPRERAFFFKASEFKVLAFSYKGGTVSERATRFVKRITKNEELQAMAEELAPKLEAWVTALAENSVKRGLERFPVYRLKDDLKGWAISVSLKSVEVKDGKIVAVVSVWQLTWTVLLTIAIFLVLVAAFFMAPEVLLPFLFLGAFTS